jgi:transcriptional regulator with GAF, ATPase, and Fis domain
VLCVKRSAGAGTWVTFVDGRPASLEVRRCHIRVVKGPDAGLARTFEQPVIRVGGQQGADFALADPKVSGLHFEVRLDDLGFRVRDVGSTNGTYVAGLRIVDAHVPPGAIISVGDSQLAFEPGADAVSYPLSASDRFAGLVGGSPAMRQLYARLEKIAATDATVLIEGETGTGKDVVAEAIHVTSPRSAGSFVVLDCGAIAANLIESELFGHDKGAFTGATTTYPGAFERADGGTLFLDEIGELPLELQPKLLGAIERREIRRVGGNAPLRTDIRVIAATNRDLGVEVSRGAFREDLYYRLAVARVAVPTLRERKQDIPALVSHFLAELPGARTRLKSRTLALMQKHDWPGNVRELRNMVERAALLDEVPESTGSLARERPAQPADSRVVRVDLDIDLPYRRAKRAVTDEFERVYVSALLERHGNNVSAVARACGADRMTIHKIVQRFKMR